MWLTDVTNRLCGQQLMWSTVNVDNKFVIS